MRNLIILSTLLLSINTFAIAERCPSLKSIRMKMETIASNIANTNTTRTPEGGPYKPKQIKCKNKNCEIKEIADTQKKYEPSHPDADENGYVSYPSINLATEMTEMVTATREYEVALESCKRTTSTRR